MIAAIVGGAIIPLGTGKLADHIGLQAAFLLPAICYVYIAGFGLASSRRNLRSRSVLPCRACIGLSEQRPRGTVLGSASFVT